MVLVSPIAPVRLADVLSSCLLALQAEDNPLGLSPVKKAAVLLVDGLGAENLRENSGHARRLMRAWRRRDLSADSGFPSTTASALTTLTTGVRAGQHGIVGYSLQEPVSGDIINHLKSWSPLVDPATWQRVPTLFQKAQALGIPSLSQGEPRFEHSDFTKAVWRGSNFAGTGSLTEQFDNLRSFFDSHDSALGYLYWPALDRTGHASGSESDSWLHRLEELDGWVSELDRLLGPEEGLIVTADHGMVDVPPEDKIFVDYSSPLLEGVQAWAGEPRAPQLYLAPGASLASLVAQWRELLGDQAHVVTRQELVDGGWLGPVDPGVVERIGDIVILCVGSLAVYHSPTASKMSAAMVGQHGSITQREREVPVIPLGAWG